MYVTMFIAYSLYPGTSEPNLPSCMPKAEAGSRHGCELQQTHPADILASCWLCGKPAAFVITVTSPLNPSFPSLKWVSAAGAAAVATELRKHSANHVKCSELVWTCIPLVVSGARACMSLEQRSCSSLFMACITHTLKYNHWF